MASVNSATCPPLVFEGSLLCTKVRGKWHVTSPAEVPRWCQLKCVNDDTRLPWTANVTLKDLFGHCPCDDCRLEHGTAGRFEALANQFYVDVLGLVETSSDVEQLAKSVFKQAMSKRRHTELVADLTALLCYKNLQVDQFSFKKAFISETQTRFDRALERARQLDDSADVTLAREKLLQVTVFISQAHSRRLIPWKVIRASVDVLIGEVNSNVHPAACEVCMEGAVSLLCGLGPRADLDVWAPWLETLKMKSLPARIAKMITSLGLNADEGSSSACRTESGSIQKF
ncbi:MAG: uncharacterized protein KVP18_000403 [Porospora cf. gigantea A]|uniref:uncharacterized protein n=1 Tax=Porospora cf. gigantea A TaxID=2853593 RepID=UPI00355AB8A0|nr:MAG: hypothetical protein KVP18_000403 [Porospora cf. gigantea A]